MSAMETTFTVRTDTDNDAMQVPDGIETVVVNDSAERVIVPPGVQIIRLQTGQGSGGGGGGGGGGQVHALSRSKKDSTERYIDLMDELMRPKRSVSTSAPSRSGRMPVEKSLSLPSCPPSPPGSRSAGTDVPDFRAATRPPPIAETAAENSTEGAAEPAPEPPSAPAEEKAEEAPPPPRDIFDDRTLQVDRQRVINQQPTAAAPAAATNGRLVRYAGETEGEMRDPLVSHGTAKMRKLDSFGWREEFERGEKENKPTIQKFGRAVADIACCWLGV